MTLLLSERRRWVSNGRIEDDGGGNELTSCLIPIASLLDSKKLNLL